MRVGRGHDVTTNNHKLNRAERDELSRRLDRTQQMGRVNVQLGVAIDMSQPEHEREARLRLHAALAAIVAEGPESPRLAVGRCSVWGATDDTALTDQLYEGYAKEIIAKRLAVTAK